MPDLYDSPEAGDGAPPGPEDEAPEKEKDDSAETFLVPKSALGGKATEPGTECKFRVVKEYEDEVEFEYVKHEDEGAKPSRMDDMVDKMAATNAGEEA